MRDVNEEEFDQLVSEGGPVIADFWANWCGPCRLLAPVLQQVADTRGHITAVKIDVDVNSELARRWDILSIPTLVLIQHGQEQRRIIGAVGQRTLEELIDSTLQP